MRIAEISTLARPVPPPGEGSVESLVSAITEGLVARGHDVTLFATAGSRTTAALRSPVPTGYRDDPRMWDWQLYEAYQAREAFAAWRDFDVIHCHAYHFGLLFCDFVPTPSLHSVHVEPGPDYLFLAQRTHNRHLHFCSRYQAEGFAGVAGVHVIPHGIDVNRFHVAPPQAREDYAVFLGRFIPDKGPLAAIRAAREFDIPLKLAAPANEYFEEAIRPEVDGRDVEYVGEVRNAEKADLLARARALLYPVERGEPFGLVLVEAMASGLPVVATNRGAVPEIVEHGRTGWIAEDPADLVRGLREVERLDRDAIRRRAEERFSSAVMVDRIEKTLVTVAEEAVR